MLHLQWYRISIGLIFLIFLVCWVTTKDTSSKRELRVRNKREGSWSGWSVWSPCSRSCGGGIRTQIRQCQLRRSRNKSKEVFEEFKAWKNVSSRHCEGHATRHHLCNIKPCEEGNLDIRSSQCKAFDNRPFMGKVYQWEAFIDERNPCSLTCRAKGFRFLATLNKSVIDGTPCSSSPFDLQVCISGSCMAIGCDGIAGSQRRLDKCGVCGGDNSTCRVVSGIFTRPQLPVGYNMVAHLPRNACNIQISQIRRSPNYLALRKNNGDYIVNGDFRVSRPGEYEGAGTKFVYTRQDLKSLETIAAQGPLQEPIDLMVLSQQPNPGIKYEYMMPLSDAPIPPVPGTDGLGTHIFNGNHQRQLSAATSRPTSFIPPPENLQSNANPFSGKQNGLTTNLFPGDSAASYNSKVHPHLHNHHGRRRNHPGHHNKLNGPASDHKFYWKITAYSNCSEPCGGGVQRPILRCIRGVNGTPVHDRRCSEEDKPPIQTVRCNLKPCPAEWVVGTWTKCSEACGEGFETRTIHCQQRVSPTLTMRVAEGACLAVRPESRKPCFYKPCRKWETSEWSQCSASCGNGIRNRQLRCVDADGGSLDQSACDHSDKPLDISPCNMGPCEGVNWFVSSWSKDCSAKCGAGLQTRHVVCSALKPIGISRSAEDTNLIEDEDVEPEDTRLMCDESKKPANERDCFSDRYCAESIWFTSPWSECSASCGQGLKTRLVLCVQFTRGKFKVVDIGLCSPSTKPDDQIICGNDDTTNPNLECSARWFTTEWGECSSECGGGHQKRSVSCRDSNWTRTSNECIDGERPMDKRSCNEAKCSQTNTDFSGMVKDNPPDSTAQESLLQSTNPTVSIIVSSTTYSPRSQGVMPTPQNHSAINQEPNEEPDDTECSDQYKNCHLVVQSRLCRYKYYRSVCCSSCSEL